MPNVKRKPRKTTHSLNLTWKKYARNFFIMISGILFPAALTLFHSFTLQFPAKAS